MADNEQTKSIDEHDALVTIAHGAVVTSGGISAQRALIAATEFVLVAGLGKTAYGIYALAWRISQVLIQLVTFGSVPALQRFVPAGDHDRRRRIVGLAYATTVGVGACMAIGVWLAAPAVNAVTISQPSFVPTVRLFGLIVGLTGVVMVAGSVFRSLGAAQSSVAFNRVLRPGARLVGAAAAIAVGASVVGVAAALAITMGLLAGGGVLVSVRVTGIVPTLRGVRTDLRQFYNHAGPVAMSSLGKVFQTRLDLLLVGVLLTSVETGVYNVVVVIVAVGWIPLLSFNQLLPPVASDLYAADEMATLNAVYTAVTRLIVTAVVPLLAVIGVYGSQLLGLFGPGFTDGYAPLVVYLGGVFAGSAVGATGWLLMMTDHQYIRMAFDWGLAVANVVLSYLFVLEFGMVGAALGTALTIAVQNGIQILLLRRFEGLFPFDWSFLRPLAAGVVMTGVLLLVRELVGGLAAVPTGAAVGLVAYVGALLLLGVAPRDRLVVGELVSRYRRTIPRAVSRPRS